LLSWIFNRGRCSSCAAAVSWRYPVIESATAAIFVGAWAAAGGDLVKTALLALTGFSLIVITVADLEQRIIPDAMLLFLMPIALVWRGVTGAHWIDAAAGAVFGLGISLALRWAFKRWRDRDALGLGDVKFLGVAGVFIGMTGFGRFLIVAGCAGIVLGLAWRLGGKGKVFPFGPALCLALAVELVSGGG
jgi:leader peptidase (prepilin peptidase)/N-methyltransferase